MRRSSPVSTPSPSDGFASVDPGSSLARALFQNAARCAGTKTFPNLLTRPRPFIVMGQGGRHVAAHHAYAYGRDWKAMQKKRLEVAGKLLSLGAR